MTRKMQVLLCSIVAMAAVLLPQVCYAKKVALVIGISDYKTMRLLDDKQSNMVLGDLYSPANDAKSFSSLLINRFGFRNEDVKLLVDSQATKQAIRDAMTGWLVSKVREDDDVVVYISGHGTQVLSKGADPNEIWDQAYLAYDYKPVTTPAEANPKNRNIILDNDFGQLFATLGEVTNRIVFVADCCYSGTISRDAAFKNVCQAKWIAPNKNDVKIAKSVESDNTMDIVDDSVTLIAACADAEQANEAEMSDGKWHSVLSYYLMDVMSSCAPSMSYAQMVREVKANVQSKFRQTPQLISRFPQRSVFGGAISSGTAPSVDETPVTYPDGYYPSSPAVVYDPNDLPTTEVITEAYPTHEVITEAPQVSVQQNTDSSTTVITPGSSIAANTSTSTSILVGTPDVYDGELYVYVIGDKGLAGEVAAQIRGINNIRVTDNRGLSDRILWVTKNGSRIHSKLSLRDGVVEYDVKVSSVNQLADKMRPFLLKSLLVKMISSARSNDPRIAPRLSLWNDISKNINIKETTTQETGLPRLYLNTPVSFDVSCEEPAYLTLIDIGTDGTMCVLLPNDINPSHQKMEPYQSYRIPNGEMGFKLVVEAPTGTEMVVAIASREPIDWSGANVKYDRSRAGIGIIDPETALKLFRVNKQSVQVTTTVSTQVSVDATQGILPNSGFGISFVLADVVSAP